MQFASFKKEELFHIWFYEYGVKGAFIVNMNVLQYVIFYND